MRILQEALTFDDVLLVPAYSDVLAAGCGAQDPANPPHQPQHPIDLRRHGFGHRGAARDQHGPGRRHRHHPQEHDTAGTGAQVRTVKKFESGVIKDPITVTPDMSVGDVLKLTRAHNISGVPVVEGERLVGIVTSRDLRFETRYNETIGKIMTGKEQLVTVQGRC